MHYLYPPFPSPSLPCSPLPPSLLSLSSPLLPFPFFPLLAPPFNVPLHSFPLCLPGSPFFYPTMHACILSRLPSHTHAGFAAFAQLAHLLCSTSLVCVHHLAYPRSGSLGISLSSTGTNHSHRVQHYVRTHKLCSVFQCILGAV